MTPDGLRALVTNLTVWQSGGKRAPHKPLLLLLALGQFSHGIRRFPYRRIEEPLIELLDVFGPPRANHTAFSFWRLQTDGVWEVEGAEAIRYTAAGDMFVTDARRLNPVGRFPEQMENVLDRHSELIAEISQALMDAHFPDTLHDDILLAVNLEPELLRGEHVIPVKRKRDPYFRRDVVRAYENRCGVCGFDTYVANRLVGVDAAHVKWHQANGDDDVTNGIALCALHHRLLDGGAFSFEPNSGDLFLIVAEDARGGTGFQDWLMRYHRKPIATPFHPENRIAEANIVWHKKEVFKSRARS